MTNITDFPKVILPEGFDDRREYETPFRGYLGPIFVEAENGCRYPIFFVDTVRMQQELTVRVNNGEPYYTEPGLVVLPEVTVQAIRDCLPLLWKDHFFDHLKPIEAALD